MGCSTVYRTYVPLNRNLELGLKVNIKNVRPLTVNVSHTEEEAKAEAEEVQVIQIFLMVFKGTAYQH
jgi:hypothetical protein